jgi:hypothetical protein
LVIQDEIETLQTQSERFDRTVQASSSTLTLLEDQILPSYDSFNGSSLTTLPSTDSNNNDVGDTSSGTDGKEANDATEEDQPENATEEDQPENATEEDQSENATEEDQPENATEEDQPENATEEDQPENGTEEDQPENATEEDQPENATEEDQPENATEEDQPEDECLAENTSDVESVCEPKEDEATAESAELTAHIQDLDLGEGNEVAESLAALTVMAGLKRHTRFEKMIKAIITRAA